MSKDNSKKPLYKMISENRRGRYDYHIEDTFEAGIALSGTEVKSLRRNKSSIADAHADEIGGELFLHNVHIPEYLEANRYNHYPTRPRKLLLHKKQLRKLIGQVTKKGKTIIPLKMYFNEKNLVKVEIAIATGKKKYDKREAIKAKDERRSAEREFKQG